MFSNLVDELLRFQGCFVPDVVVQESIIDDISVVGIQELLYLTAWILIPYPLRVTTYKKEAEVVTR